MKLEINFNTENASDQLTDLHRFIAEQNLKGILPKITQTEAKEGEMGIGEYMPVIQLLMGSTVVAAGVKGLFDIVKNYFELKKQKITSATELEKMKLEQQKISFAVETNDGKKINIQLSTLNEAERTRFYEMVDRAFSPNQS